MRIKMIDIDGVRTRYLHAGDGYPLMLMHGVGVSGDTFLRNIDVLGERYSVYAPDMLGHGFTDSVDYQGGPPQPHTVRHLGKLADALGLDHYCVGGSSYGALIAALMYFDRPQRVDSVILIGSGSTFHPPEGQAETLKAAFANGSKAMTDPTLDSCRLRMANILHDPAMVPEEMLLTQLTSYALPDRLDAYKATVSGMAASVDSDVHRVYTRLEKMDVPCLVITGRQDIRSDVDLTIAGCKRMPNAELIIFDDCGHMPYMEHPAQFNEAVAAFLRRTIDDRAAADAGHEAAE
jgi:pimeloyl-ACP methyl ester carboxylesterase